MFFLDRFIHRSQAKEQSATPVRVRPGIDVSLTGLIYILMMAFLAFAAMNTQANLLFGVFGLMVGVLVVSFLVSSTMFWSFAVQRQMPDHGVVAKPLTLTYEFLNKKKFWPALSVCVSELEGVEGFTRQPQSYLLHAAAGMTARVPVEVIPKRRGIQTLGRYQLSTSFPFGFVKRAVERSNSDKMITYPSVGRVDPRLLALCTPAEKSGPTIRPRRGGADEFYGLKEHRVGENAHFIYWRRSARTGVLVSKEMTQVAPPRLLILVDTYISKRTHAAHALVEKSIAMAASLANAALEQGLPVGIHAWMNEWNGLPPTRGKRQGRDIMALLACLPLNVEQDCDALLESAQSLAESGTTSVLITGSDAELGLSDKLRGGLVVVSAASPQADAWFKFDPNVRFDQCAPSEQEAEIVD